MAKCNQLTAVPFKGLTAWCGNMIKIIDCYDYLMYIIFNVYHVLLMLLWKIDFVCLTLEPPRWVNLPFLTFDL